MSACSTLYEFRFTQKSRLHIGIENRNTLTRHLNRNLCHSVIIVVKSHVDFAVWHQIENGINNVSE